jgi:hypothetical protein
MSLKTANVSSIFQAFSVDSEFSQTRVRSASKPEPVLNFTTHCYRYSTTVPIRTNSGEYAHTGQGDMVIPGVFVRFSQFGGYYLYQGRAVLNSLDETLKATELRWNRRTHLASCSRTWPTKSSSCQPGSGWPTRALPAWRYSAEDKVRYRQRAIKGFYWIPANLPFAERNKTANVFTLTLGPHGANIDDTMVPTSMWSNIFQM